MSKPALKLLMKALPHSWIITIHAWNVDSLGRSVSTAAGVSCVEAGGLLLLGVDVGEADERALPADEGPTSTAGILELFSIPSMTSCSTTVCVAVAMADRLLATLDVEMFEEMKETTTNTCNLRGAEVTLEGSED